MRRPLATESADDRDERQDEQPKENCCRGSPLANEDYLLGVAKSPTCYSVDRIGAQPFTGRVRTLVRIGIEHGGDRPYPCHVGVRVHASPSRSVIELLTGPQCEQVSSSECEPARSWGVERGPTNRSLPVEGLDRTLGPTRRLPARAFSRTFPSKSEMRRPRVLRAPSPRPRPWRAARTGTRAGGSVRREPRRAWRDRCAGGRQPVGRLHPG